MKEWISRFKNPAVLISLVGAIGLVLQQFGVTVDMVWLNNTITAICSVLVILGVANDSTTPGLDNPFNLRHEGK